MIRNRLSELLSERGLKISRVAKDVKIARSSLTSMVQNDSEMIRYDAIDKLCSYLHISPSDFFEHNPINFDFTFDEEPNYKINSSNEFFEITTDITKAFSIENFEFEILVDVELENKQKLNFDLDISYDKIEKITTLKYRFVFKIKNEKENMELKKYVDNLSAGLKNILFKKINKHLSEYVSKVIVENVDDIEELFPNVNEKNKTLHNEILQTNSLLSSDIFKEY
ncbi:helix-turn-helix transcriptional regulator [Staphylococcus caprae]|uniref:helix-turn-helix domain-containing protein n=1 Tax=Staphylococcus TaxID=1279 RepID=UPI0008A85C2A|nr:helix-turn-helix transcriptional regulator [Staphylococcus sp. HMSC62A08]OHS36338.1 transcriptional regulator [Staphylococcus sp. HMSC62A08]